MNSTPPELKPIVTDLVLFDLLDQNSYPSSSPSTNNKHVLLKRKIERSRDSATP